MTPNKTTYSRVTSLSVFVVNYVYVNNRRLLTSYRDMPISVIALRIIYVMLSLLQNSLENQDQEKSSMKLKQKAMGNLPNYLILYEPI